MSKLRAVDVIFLDPPYEAAEEYLSTLSFLGMHSSGLLAEGAVVIAEHGKKQPLEERYGGLQRGRVLPQGAAALSYYKVG